VRNQDCLLVFVLLLTGCGADDPKPIAPTHGVKFTNAAAKLGVDFVHQTPPPSAYDSPTVMGSGCALFDFDQDGVLDLYLVNLGDPDHPTSNALYRQHSTTARFENVTESTNADAPGMGMGVAAGDLNNDGFPELYVTNFGEDRLLLNEAGQSFKDITKAAGITNIRWGASVSFVDYDRDGWLDIFISNYVDYLPLSCRQFSGTNRDFCAPHRFFGEPDVLFRNITGDQPDSKLPVFKDVSNASNISSKPGPGLAVVCADFTNDGWPDLYVANDQTANFLWVNQHDGTFKEEAIQRGCANDMIGNAQASMGTAVAFFDDDPTPDIFLTHLTGESNTLYISDKNGFFDDRSQKLGVADPAIPLTGFGTAFIDVDLDGRLDLLTVNGTIKRPDGVDESDVASNKDFWKPYRQPHQLLLNSGNRFRALTQVPGLDSNEVSRGLATGDIDNDGDVDIVVCNIGARPEVLINDTVSRAKASQPNSKASSKSHYLSIRCVLPQAGNRDAIGAQLRVVSKKESWRAIVQPGLSYLSSNDPRVHLGLGQADSVDHIDVIWPDGRSERFQVQEVDRQVTLSQGAGESIEKDSE
jgi:enediyne biosynthesis protein E4